MAVKGKSGASFKPSDGSEGGGLLDNVDVVWKEVGFKDWDYNGTQPAVPALRILMEVKDGEDVEQFFSCGKVAAEDYEISKDGKMLLQKKDTARPLAKSSNFLILMQSLIDAKFPEDKLTDDASTLEGLDCHMVRVKAPERKGLAPRKARADGKTYEAQNFVVDVINRLPWDKAAGKGGSSKKDEGASDAIAEKATATILEILGDTDKPMTKQQLAGKVHTKLSKEKDKDAMAAAQLANKDEFLSNGPWSFEKGMVSQG